LSLSTHDDVWLALLVLVKTVATVIWLVRSVSEPKTPTARELAGRFEIARSMSGAQFEFFIAELLQAMGHRVTMLGGAGDQGVDIVVSTMASASRSSARITGEPLETSRCKRSSPARGTTAASKPG
jgi:HJR/Mrr/RecB family endonuclease